MRWLEAPTQESPNHNAGRPAGTPEMTLEEWLARCERLHPAQIDMGLERVAQVRDALSLRFTAPVVTVAGTNGKGSTCAMLEAIARGAGYHVGVYTSPHLVRFEERCRIDGQAVTASELLPHFEAVEATRGDVPLTYFEFTTLVILRLLAQQPLDLVVLEVGLGGRLDAVNVIDADCGVITCIDLDHMQLLGPDRESIGFEKAGIMRSGRPVIVSDPMPPQRVLDHGAAIGADLRRFGVDFGYSAQQGGTGVWQQWAWRGRHKRYSGLGYPALRGTNQLLNASGVLAAFEALHPRLPITAQAVRTGLANVDLPGRFQIIPGQPALVLDVAHNPHAVATLALNLDQMGFYPRTFAVFGAMRDKDVAGMFERMRPLVDEWMFTDLPTPRAMSAEELDQAYLALKPASASAVVAAPSSRHASATAALRAALDRVEPADRIVVFGSFYTVGGVLSEGVPRLSARHAAAQS